MIKAVFIDIDGTLRDDNKNISKRTKDIIKKVTNNGILIVLCSGRHRGDTEKVSRQCFASKYIISSNGGNIYNYENNENLYTNCMDKEAIIQLYKIAESKNVRFIMNVGDVKVVNKIKHSTGEIKLEEDIKDFVYKNDVEQCVIQDDDFKKVEKLFPEIEKIKNVEIKNRHNICDIANKESNKGNAIKKLLKILNIKKSDTIAIGDDANDLSMFNEVEYKVAVSNAVDILKENADEIILSNNEDGVAKFLERIFERKLEVL